MNTIQNTQDKVLIVDDSLTMRLLLKQALEAADFKVDEAENGEMALQLLPYIQPDIVLLDVEMPGINGFETCQALRQLPAGQFVPIVITTSLDDFASINKAYEARATDFITKPINWDLIGHRVRYIIRTSRDFIELQNSKRELLEVKDELVKLNAGLEERIAASTYQLKKTNEELSNTLNLLKSAQEQLISSEKMTTFGHFVTQVSQEFHAPIEECLKQNLSLKELLNVIVPSFDTNTLKKLELKDFLQAANNINSNIMSSLTRMANLISSFKQLFIYQANETHQQFLLKTQLEEILFSLAPAIAEKQAKVIINCADDIVVNSFPEVWFRVISGLVMNSLIHAFDDMGGIITITAGIAENEVTLTCADNGKGIEADHMEKLFSPFFTTKSELGFTGLGLHIIYKQITEILSGTISCDSTMGHGTTFTIRFPTTPMISK